MKYLLSLVVAMLAYQPIALALEKREMIEKVLVAIDEKQIVVEYTNRLFDRLASDGSFSDTEVKKVKAALDFAGFIPEAVRFFEGQLSDEDATALYDYFVDPVNAALYRSLAEAATGPDKGAWDRLKKETEQSDPERWTRAEQFYRSALSKRFHAAQSRFSPVLKEYAGKTLMRAIEVSIEQ